MKRLLADRPSFWIGGAYCGTELPWESLGYFGTEPTATPNSFRYGWGKRVFGTDNALLYLSMSDACEHLWDINDLPIHPYYWVDLDSAQQSAVSEDGWETLDLFRQRLDALEDAVGEGSHAKWFGHVRLFGTYFEYHLRRLEDFSAMRDIVRANRDLLAKGTPLPEEARRRLLDMHREVYALSDRLDAEMSAVPGNMLARTRGHCMTRPFREWVGGYDFLLGRKLDIPQFAGEMEVDSTALSPGDPFTLKVQLRNTGVIPWVPEATDQRIELSGDAAKLGLPTLWRYEGEPTVFGDRRVIELAGTVPQEAGQAAVKVEFIAPFRHRHAIAVQEVTLDWR
jgi:hypothetical protein